MNKPRLLIAEDDLALSALLEEYLSESGYDVLLCHRGDDAIRHLEKEHFDLVLSDIVMPGADGLSLLAEAKNEPHRTLVILMTGYSGIENAIHAVENGAYDFVSKPFQLPEVRVRIDNAARYQSLLRQWQAVNNGAAMDPVKESYMSLQDSDGMLQADEAAMPAYDSAKG